MYNVAYLFKIWKNQVNDVQAFTLTGSTSTEDFVLESKKLG